MASFFYLYNVSSEHSVTQKVIIWKNTLNQSMLSVLKRIIRCP